MIVRAVSYAGCGFNGAYYIGVNRAIFSSQNSLFDPKNVNFSGASAGSLGSAFFNLFLIFSIFLPVCIFSVCIRGTLGKPKN